MLTKDIGKLDQSFVQKTNPKINKTEESPKKLNEEQVEYEKIKKGLFLFSDNYFLFRDYLSMGNLIGITNEGLLGGTPYRDYSLMLMDDNGDLFNSSISTCFANTSNLTQDQKKLNDELLSVFNALPYSDEKNSSIKKLEEFLKKNGNNQDLKTFLNLERGKSGLTVLHTVLSMAWKHYKERSHVVKLLLRAGADPDKQDSEGRTPLHYAAIIGDVYTLDVLRRDNADFGISDKQGKTPQQVAGDNRYCIRNLFLTSQQRELRSELSDILIAMRSGFEEYCDYEDSLDCIVNLTEDLKEFLGKHKNNQDLKVILSLWDHKGKLLVFSWVREVYDFFHSINVSKKEVRNLAELELEKLISEIETANQELYYNREKYLSRNLWSNLTQNQQRMLSEFPSKIREVQNVSQLGKIADEAINSGIRFNFPIYLNEMMHGGTYNFADCLMKRISELEKNPKVASDIICKLVSRGVVFYNADSIDLVSELESKFEDHKTNMIKAHEGYVNRTLKFMEVIKGATNGRIKDAKVDNSTLYLEYSEDSTIDVAKIIEGKRSLELTQGNGRNVVKIGKSEVEIITQEGIRDYTNLADGSDIVLTFHTSLGGLEVRLYPDKQDLIKVEVKDQEKWKKLKNCEEEIGKNCLLGGYSVHDAIEQGYFARHGKLHQPSEKITLPNEKKKNSWCEIVSKIPSSEQTTSRAIG